MCVCVCVCLFTCIPPSAAYCRQHYWSVRVTGPRHWPVPAPPLQEHLASHHVRGPSQPGRHSQPVQGHPPGAREQAAQPRGAPSGAALPNLS